MEEASEFLNTKSGAWPKISWEPLICSIIFTAIILKKYSHQVSEPYNLVKKFHRPITPLLK